MEAHTLGLNDFGMPKVMKDSDAVYMQIIRLIMLEKGTFQSHPDMGVGIRTRYRHRNDENLLESLQHDIAQQIETYLPELTDVEVSCAIAKEQNLNIMINTANGAYAFDYDGANNTIVPSTYNLDQL